MGKALTSRAAEYPEGLARAYALLVAKSFKTTLQMEWWRFQLKVKKEEVSAVQVNWLASKQKKQLPPTNLGELASSKRAWSAEDVENELKPLEGPSKKARREGENQHFIGDMRNPAKAAARLTKVLETGKGIRRVYVDEVCSGTPPKPSAQQKTRGGSMRARRRGLAGVACDVGEAPQGQGFRGGGIETERQVQITPQCTSLGGVEESVW